MTRTALFTDLENADIASERNTLGGALIVAIGVTVEVTIFRVGTFTYTLALQPPPHLSRVQLA